MRGTVYILRYTLPETLLIYFYLCKGKQKPLKEMSQKNYDIKLSHKLRELELVMKNITSSERPDNIDIDIALEKTRELYSLLLITRDKSSNKEQEPGTAKEGEKSPVPADPVVPQEEDDHFFEVENRIPGISDKDKKPEDPSSHIVDTDKPETEKKMEQESKPETTDNEKNSSKKIDTLADRYHDSQNHINEALGDKRKGDDLTSRLQNKPIRNLRDSIGLNEKFLFIRELFDNNPETYNKCIDFLNNASSYQEALDYLKRNFDWDEETDASEKLFNLVKRKHRKE